MSVIYEVNLSVQKDIAAQYRDWLLVHAREMRALPGFTGAHILESLDTATDPGEITFCTQYERVDRAALDEYLRVHSERMRAEGVSRFGNRFRASRRILHDLGSE